MKTNIALYLVVMMLCSFCLRAQSYGYERANITNVKNVSLGDLEYTNDNAGNLLLGGTFSDSMDIDPGPGRVYKQAEIYGDLFIQKQNSLGDLVWSYVIGGTGFESVRGITVDRQNNIYVAGRFQNTVDFDPGPGVSLLTSTSFSGNFILKISPAGQFIWVRKIGEDAVISDIAHDRKGGIYTSGSFQNTVDFNPGAATFNLTSPNQFSLFVQKLDTAGNFQWAKAFNNNAANANGQDYSFFRITVDTAGNPALCGTFTELVDFDPGPSAFLLNAGSSIADYKMFVTKLDTLGNFLWAKRFGQARPMDWKTDGHNNMILTGDYPLINDFDPGTPVVTLPKLGWADIFIVKIDASGNFIWAVPLTSNNNDYCRSVNVDAANNIYLVGYSELTQSNPSNMDFDPGPGTYSLPMISGGGVSYLYRISAGGNFRSMQYLASQYSAYRNVAFRDTNNLYILTYVTDSLDCNHGTGVAKVYEEWPGGAGYAVIRLTACSGGSSSATIYDTVCNSFISPSNLHTWTTSSIYRDTIPNATGCDSVLTFNLTVNHNQYDTLYPQSCGPYRSPSTNHTWLTSGIYQDTLMTSRGCDSVLTVFLTVNGNSFSTISEYTCDTYVSPGGRYSWSTTGIYKDTIPNFKGCDSIITINLTVHDTSVTRLPNGLGANSNVGTFQWLDCNNGYAIIPGATADVFYPVQTGRYAVIVSYGACRDTSGCHSFSATGIEAQGKGNIRIAPNPTNGLFTVTLPEAEAIVDVQLVSVEGKVISTRQYHHKDLLIIDITDHHPGIFFLKLNTKNWTKTVKIIKNR